MKFLLHIRQVLSSTGINASLFSYFPVFMRNEWAPSRNFEILILCAGFLMVLR